MQTPQILPVSTPSAPRGNAAAPASEGPEFEQVLTREVAERNAVKDKPAETEARREDIPPASESAQDESMTEPAAAPAADAAQDAAAAASAEMLALVASIAQFQGVAGNAVQAGVDAATMGEDLSEQPGQNGKRAGGAAFGALQGVLDGQGKAASAQQDAAADDALITARSDVSGAAAAARTAPAPVTDFSAALKEVSLLLQPAQQSAAAQAATATVSDRIAPRVGSNGWDQAIGQRIVWMVSGEQQSASLELNPPELGPLKVVLQVSNAQATANFIAAQPEVRQALEAAMPKLRDMLGEAGIHLGQASVDSGAQQEQQSSRHAEGGRRRVDVAAVETGAAATAVTHIRPTTTGLGMVDTFA